MLLPKRQWEGFAEVSGQWWWENRRDSASPESAGSLTGTGNSHPGFYEVRGAAGRHFPSLSGRLMRSPPGEGRLCSPRCEGQWSAEFLESAHASLENEHWKKVSTAFIRNVTSAL